MLVRSLSLFEKVGVLIDMNGIEKRKEGSR